MPAKLVDTATLIRGQVYSYRHNYQDVKDNPLKFVKGEAVIVTNKDLLADLEDLVDEVEDGEGEAFEKPVFRIARKVQEPDSNEGSTRVRRLAADRPIRRRRMKK